MQMNLVARLTTSKLGDTCGTRVLSSAVGQTKTMLVCLLYIVVCQADECSPPLLEH